MTYVMETKALNLQQISQEEKLIAKYLETSLGKRPKFFIHRDERQILYMSLLGGSVIALLINLRL